MLLKTFGKTFILKEFLYYWKTKQKRKYFFPKAFLVLATSFPVDSIEIFIMLLEIFLFIEVVLTTGV